uniref:Ciliogenesis-associated TTC17-interacting protein n=1 Tax=Hippocampus comes TaxID=109280 RepID=A0A3Q2XC15_HIPCM
MESPERRCLKSKNEQLMFFLLKGTILSLPEPVELTKCVFADSLVTISEGGRDLGRFCVSMEFAHRAHQPCVLLHAQSQGAIDDSPCGTTVTGEWGPCLTFLHMNILATPGPCLHGALSKNFFFSQFLPIVLIIDHSYTCYEEVTRDSVSYSMTALRGLVTEGSNFLLMRLLALRKKIPEHMTCISFDQKLRISLEQEQMEIEGETVEVFGVERIVHSVDESPTTWQCYFLADGHLASRLQVGSPVTMRLLQLPSQKEEGIHTPYDKIPLVWEEDIQMRSKFLDRKEELKADHASYLRAHPEIRALISDFLQFLLLKKPNDVFQFAREYFLPFTSNTSLDT